MKRSFSNGPFSNAEGGNCQPWKMVVYDNYVFLKNKVGNIWRRYIVEYIVQIVFK